MVLAPFCFSILPSGNAIAQPKSPEAARPAPTVSPSAGTLRAPAATTPSADVPQPDPSDVATDRGEEEERGTPLVGKDAGRAAGVQASAVRPNSDEASATVGVPIPGSTKSPEESAIRSVSVDWVVRTLMANNPELEGARLNTQKAKERVAQEEGRYPYMFQADAGYTHSSTPSLAGGDEVRVTTRDSVAVGSQISRVFPMGTQATVRLEGQRYKSTRPTTGGIVIDQPGVGYQASARATVMQPLLRGAGRGVNEAELRAARLSRAASAKAYDSRLSGLLYDALAAYWELWYASRATEIEQSALELAQAQLEEARKRTAMGALAHADALQFEIRVAQLGEAVVSARFDETQQSLTLGRIVGDTSPAVMPWRADATEPPELQLLPQTQVLARVVAQSPEVVELEEAWSLARERATTAGEEYRSRLDVQGWVEAAGLGSGRPWPAVRQVAGLDAVSVYGGIVYETPLDSKRRDAARAQARLDVRIAEQNLIVLRQRLQNQTVQLFAQHQRAQAGLEAAQATVAISEKLVVLERQRFALGGSTVLQVQEAEDALRQARLRVARARVNQVGAALALDQVTGRLLERFKAE